MPPPIYLREKEKWVDIRSALSNNTKFEASHSNQGIKLQLSTPDEYRKVTSFLKEKGHYFHTFALSDERVFRTVVKGLPKEIPCQEIVDAIKAHDILVLSVQRMSHPRTKRPYGMVLVTCAPPRASASMMSHSYVGSAVLPLSGRIRTVFLGSVTTANYMVTHQEIV